MKRPSPKLKLSVRFWSKLAYSMRLILNVPTKSGSSTSETIRSKPPSAREREAAKVVQALYEQKITLEKVIKLPAFVNFLLNYTWTDIGFKDIVRLLPVMGKIESNDITLRGVPSYSKMIGKASAVVHYEEETEIMFEEIKNQ